jgi:hypothetical protein
MATLTPEAQAVIDAFGQQTGVTADQLNNLQTIINQSPSLIDQLNSAVAAGSLTQIRPLPSGLHVGGRYDWQANAIDIPLNILDTPASGTFSQGEPTHALGHEFQHALNRPNQVQAYEAFKTAAAQLAASPDPVHDYTPLVADLIASNRNNEASAQVGGWNAFVDMVRANGHPNPTLEDIYRADTTRRMHDYIDVSNTTPPAYTMKPGVTLNADMSMSPTPDNLEAMAVSFFDKPATALRLGANGNSDYYNHYGTYGINMIGYYERANAKPLPDGSMPQVTLNMTQLRLSESLLEQNGINLGAPGRTQTYFDSSTSPPTQGRFDHSSHNHQYMPAPPLGDAHSDISSEAGRVVPSEIGLERFPSYVHMATGLRGPHMASGDFHEAEIPTIAARVAEHALSERIAPNLVALDKAGTHLLPLESKSNDFYDPANKVASPLPVEVARNAVLSEVAPRLEALEATVAHKKDAPAQGLAAGRDEPAETEKKPPHSLSM